MKKLLILGSIIACACGSNSTKRGGGLNTGTAGAQITLVSGNNNDLVIPGGSPRAVIRLIAASGGSTLTGMASGPFQDGDLFVLRNDSTTDSITITNADAGSVAADQFLTPSAASVVLAAKMSTFVEWDTTAGSFVVGPGGPTQFATGTTFSTETVTTGALSPTKYTYLSTTGTVAYTLPDGTVAGQIKKIEATVDATSPLGTVTITTPFSTEPATHVFTAVGQTLTLVWKAPGWHVVDKHRAGHQVLVIGTTLTAGLDMASTYDLSVTGTVSSTTTKALPAGLVPGEVAHLDCTTAATSASGTLGFAGTSRLGAAVTSIAGIGNGASDKSLAVDMWWDGASWQIISLGTNTGVTISMLDLFIDSFFA